MCWVQLKFKEKITKLHNYFPSTGSRWDNDSNGQNFDQGSSYRPNFRDREGGFRGRGRGRGRGYNQGFDHSSQGFNPNNQGFNSGANSYYNMYSQPPAAE